MIDNYLDLETWAIQLQREVYGEWRSKYRTKEGFKIFYGPIRSNSKLMIISFNPGGNAKNFRDENLVDFEKGDFSLPKKNEYLTTNYTMARKLRKLFHEQMDLLEDCVAFPLLFFRSRNMRSWKKTHSNKMRMEMERFCYDEVEKILKKIKPKTLLVIGFKTYDRLKKHEIIDVKNEKLYRGKKGRKIAYFAQWSDIPVFVTLHLTGARISNPDFIQIQKLFFDFCK